MSHPIANPRFARLIRERGRICFPHPGDQLLDVHGLLDCHRSALHYYTTGRRDLPRLEERLAALFRMPIHALRRRLGLPLDRRLPARPLSGRRTGHATSLSQEKKPHAANRRTARRA